MKLLIARNKIETNIMIFKYRSIIINVASILGAASLWAFDFLSIILCYIGLTAMDRSCHVNEKPLPYISSYIYQYWPLAGLIEVVAIFVFTFRYKDFSVTRNYHFLLRGMTIFLITAAVIALYCSLMIPFYRCGPIK